MSKKICFFSGDITRSGGTERVSSMIANGLLESEAGGMDISFLSIVEAQEQPFFEINEGIQRYVLKDDGKWINPGVGYIPLIPRLHSFLREHEIDVIIDIDIVLDVLSIPACAGLKTKVVSWEHFGVPYEKKSLYRRLILRLTACKSDYIVTLTAKDRDNYISLLHRKRGIDFIYNPVDSDVAWNSADVINNKALITVGRLIYIKGTDMLTRLASELLASHKDWKWYVLGDGEEMSLLEEAIRGNGLEGQLILTGNVTNVADYLSRASIYVMTSRSEGLPMCLLEAMTCGLPCVSFDVPTGPSEIIDDGKNGFLIPAFDLEKMKNRIEEMMMDEDMRKRFSKQTQLTIKRFDKKMILKKWEGLLNELTSKAHV